MLANGHAFRAAQSYLNNIDQRLFVFNVLCLFAVLSRYLILCGGFCLWCFSS